ncbi:hypothetical protein Avbf_17802 [Armadillidium vulgare]|nr:hypothetical protein Avbf_17802 [Armadillidium vulgare]
MKVENENDMMLGILQEEERSLKILKIFLSNLFVYIISHYIFNLSYTKRNQKFLLYIGKFVLKISNSQTLLKSRGGNS